MNAYFFVLLSIKWFDIQPFWVHSQTWPNFHLSTTTIILESRFPHLENKGTSEQRPLVNNGHYFWVSRVVVIHWFDCIQKASFDMFTISIVLEIKVVKTTTNCKSCAVLIRGLETYLILRFVSSQISVWFKALTGCTFVPSFLSMKLFLKT